MYSFFLVFLGGGAGSIARYGVSELVKANFRSSFPLATLLSNLISCTVLALALGYFSDKLTENPALRVLLIAGFCGGFSTFSTFSYETVELMRSGHLLFAAVNVALSITACMAIIYFLTKTEIHP